MQLSYGWRLGSNPHLLSCARCGVWYSLVMRVIKIYVDETDDGQHLVKVFVKDKQTAKDLADMLNYNLQKEGEQ